VTSSSRRRRPIVVGLVALLLVVLSTMLSQPAGAVNYDGRLQLKGTGSNFTGSGHVAALVVSAGGTATYSLKVVNTGADLAQYSLKVYSDQSAGLSVHSSSSDITALTSSYDGYVTAPIAAGKSVTYTVKVTAAPGTAQSTVRTFAGLSSVSADGSHYFQLDSEQMYTEVKAPAAGTAADDLFVKGGSQPYVGGSVSGQTAAGPALKVGQSASYTLHLKNDGTAPGTIALHLDNPADLGCAAFYTTVIKDGSKIVTAAVLAGTYVTPTLKVGAAKDLTVTVKYVVAAGGGCQQLSLETYGGTSGAVQHYSYVLITAAA
jgi:hypothetical protein